MKNWQAVATPAQSVCVCVPLCGGEGGRPRRRRHDAHTPLTPQAKDCHTYAHAPRSRARQETAHRMRGGTPVVRLDRVTGPGRNHPEMVCMWYRGVGRPDRTPLEARVGASPIVCVCWLACVASVCVVQRAALLALAAVVAVASSQAVPTVDCPSPQAGTLAQFSAPLLNGTTVSLGQFVGTVTLIANVATY
jgi:hypothetical protein